jgi:hypothetical protein
MAKKRAHRPEGYRTVAAPPAPSSAPPRTRQPATPPSGRRARFEDWSRPILLRMQLLPGFLVPVLMGVMLFLGLMLPWRWAGVLIVAIAVFLTWLTAVSWPATSPGSRALRILVNLGLLALGVAKLLGLV